MLGYGIIMPILPFYVTNMGASGRELGMLTAVSAMMQFIFAPLWGSFSDHHGRKPVLLLGVAGYGITMLLFALSTRLWMLFAARALNGMISSAALPASMSIIADNTPASRRGDKMGKLGAASGFGLVLGPALGGVLSARSLSTPFFAASGLCLAAFLLVLAFLPETLPPDVRKKEVHAVTFINLSWRSALQDNGVLMLLVLVVSFGLSSFQGILGLYALQRFNMQTSQVGSIWAAIGAMLIIGQGVITGFLCRRLGERLTLRLSLLSAALAFGAMMLANGFASLLLTSAVLVLVVSMLGPVLNALISQSARLSQGISMGASAASASLGRVLGPIWAGFIYDIDQAYPFISGAAILSLALLISLLWLPGLPAEDGRLRHPQA